MEKRIQIPPAEILASAMKRRGVVTMLEVGCGIGGIISQFQGIPHRVGVDINADELALAEVSYPTINFQQVDVTHLRDTFEPGEFDLVFASDVLEHFEKETSNDVLRQMEEVAAMFTAVWSPLGVAGMDDFNATHATDGNTMRHRCIITEGEFADRGYATVVFPTYWSRYYRPEWTADGLLAIKEIGAK